MDNHDHNHEEIDRKHDKHQYAAANQAMAYPTHTTANHLKEWVNFKEPNYVKGFVLGAGIALILTNPTVKKTLIKGVTKLWGGIQGGVEELKEQIRDVQAEIVEGE